VPPNVKRNRFEDSRIKAITEAASYKTRRNNGPLQLPILSIIVHQRRQRQSMLSMMDSTTTKSTNVLDPLFPTHTASTAAIIFIEEDYFQASWNQATTPPCTPAGAQMEHLVCPNAPMRSDVTWSRLERVIKQSRDTSPSPRRTNASVFEDRWGPEEGQLDKEEYRPIMSGMGGQKLNSSEKAQESVGSREERHEIGSHELESPMETVKNDQTRTQSSSVKLDVGKR
jgi:hypothetical protein